MLQNLKKYIIWFLIWISCVWAVSYAANVGSIGALFTDITWDWKLMWDEIEDGTIDSTEIEDNTILSDDILDGTITQSDLWTNSVWSWQLQANSVWSWQLQANSVWSLQLQANSVWSWQLQANSFWSWQLQANSVWSWQLQTNSVWSYQIIDWSIMAIDLEDSYLLTSWTASDSDNLNWLGSSEFYQKTEDIIYLKNWLTTSRAKSDSFDVVVDDTLWVKQNLYVDGDVLIDGDVLMDGDVSIDGDVLIGGLKLEKKVKNNSDWITAIDNYISWNGEVTSNWVESYIVPAWKAISAIRMSGYSDDGGVCIWNIYWDASFWITNRAYIDWLSLYWWWSDLRAWSDGAWYFPTREFIIADLEGGEFSSGISYSSHYYHNVDDWVRYIDSWSTIRMYQFSYGGPGGESNRCLIEVKLWDLYY